MVQRSLEASANWRSYRIVRLPFLPMMSSRALPRVRRHQGMRVGAAFSTALDPTRPPLFSDVSEMDLLPEEVWHPSALPPPKQPRSEVCAHARGRATNAHPAQPLQGL